VSAVQAQQASPMTSTAIGNKVTCCHRHRSEENL